jgi:hypothetical protein
LNAPISVTVGIDAVDLVWLVDQHFDQGHTGEEKMRVPFRSLAAFAALLMAGSIVPYAAADDTPPKKDVPECLYRDAHYGLGAVICVALQFGQQCGEGGKWELPTDKNDFSKVCAKAQTPIPGILPVQCIYHDVNYALGAIICVGPRYGLKCESNSEWKKPKDSGTLEEVCRNAQIPSPISSAAPATSAKSP